MFTLGVAGAGLNTGAVGQFPSEVVELGEDGQFPILFSHGYSFRCGHVCILYVV